MPHGRKMASKKHGERETRIAQPRGIKTRRAILKSRETAFKRHGGARSKSDPISTPQSTLSPMAQWSQIALKEEGTDPIANKKPEAVPAQLLRAIKSHTPKKPPQTVDWRNASTYPIKSNTEPSQWAWEFLRRNRDFQKYCDNPETQDTSTEDSWTWRPRWGLASYKPYWKNFVPARTYLRHPDPSPIWTITQPARIIDRTNGPHRHSKKAHNFSIDLTQGQVAVIFDLSAINLAFLANQVNDVHKTLRLALARHQALMKNANAGVKTWKSKLLTCLRVVDALSCANPPSRKEIGQVLHKEGLVLKSRNTATIRGTEFSRATEYYMKGAYRLIYEGGYLRLLVPKKMKPRAPKKRS